MRGVALWSSGGCGKIDGFERRGRVTLTPPSSEVPIDFVQDPSVTTCGTHPLLPRVLPLLL